MISPRHAVIYLTMGSNFKIALGRVCKIQRMISTWVRAPEYLSLHLYSCLQDYRYANSYISTSIRHWFSSNAACYSQRSGRNGRRRRNSLMPQQMLFFGSQCEQLCMVQFALISLIPGLLRRLEDCADPEFDSYQETLITPTSLKSSERNSCMVR